MESPGGQAPLWAQWAKWAQETEGGNRRESLGAYPQSAPVRCPGQRWRDWARLGTGTCTQAHGHSTQKSRLPFIATFCRAPVPLVPLAGWCWVPVPVWIRDRSRAPPCRSPQVAKPPFAACKSGARSPFATCEPGSQRWGQSRPRSRPLGRASGLWPKPLRGSRHGDLVASSREQAPLWKQAQERHLSGRWEPTVELWGQLWGQTPRERRMSGSGTIAGTSADDVTISFSIYCDALSCACPLLKPSEVMGTKPSGQAPP